MCVRARVHFFDFLFPKDITVRGHVAIDVCVPVRDASSPTSTVCTTAANCCCRPLLATDSAKTRRRHPVDDTHTRVHSMADPIEFYGTFCRKLSSQTFLGPAINARV